jgi:hypothetical protein
MSAAVVTLATGLPDYRAACADDVTNSSTTSVVAAALAVCSAVVLGPLTDLHHLDSPAAVGLRFGSGCASTTAST